MLVTGLWKSRMGVGGGGRIPKIAGVLVLPWPMIHIFGLCKPIKTSRYRNGRWTIEWKKSFIFLSLFVLSLLNDQHSIFVCFSNLFIHFLLLLFLFLKLTYLIPRLSIALIFPSLSFFELRPELLFPALKVSLIYRFLDVWFDRW